MFTIVSLLRGINVGGNKRIKMEDLRTLYAEMGLRNTKTILASGNAVFQCANDDLVAVRAQLEAGILDHYGFVVKVLLRTASEMQALTEHHPYSAAELDEPKKILVVFLEHVPSASALGTLQTAHAGPERIMHDGAHLFCFYPDGMGRSKLDNAFIERHLQQVGTGRNWNTVQKLAALVRDLSA